MKHYDAFISYRHTPLDMFVAKTVQKMMEEFKLPKNIKRNKSDWERKKIERVFRDQDELPLTSDLSDQIYQSLMESDYLVVICSPRLKESLWCSQEITTFIEMRGYDHILPVLIEGEPNESFPEEIIYREEEYIDEYGNVVVGRVPVEPLAADVRGKTKREIKKKLESEILRLLAPMFGVDFDDLKQRHRERKMKRTFSLLAGATAFFGALGIYVSFQNVEIQNQNEKINAQSEVLLSQKNELQDKNQEIQTQMDNLLYREAQDYGVNALQYLGESDYQKALEYAYMSVTADEDGNPLPVTPEGINAMIETTHAYDIGDYRSPYKIIKMENQIVHEIMSPSYLYVLLQDMNGNIAIYDRENANEVGRTKIVNEVKFSYTEMDGYYLTQFIGDDIIVYEQDYLLVFYDFLNDQIIDTMTHSDFSSYPELFTYVVGNTATGITYIQTDKAVYAYRIEDKSFELLLKYSDIKGLEDFSESYRIRLSNEENMISLAFANKDEEVILFCFDIIKKQVVYQVDINVTADQFKDYSYHNGAFYYVSKKENQYKQLVFPIVCIEASNGKELWSKSIDGLTYFRDKDINFIFFDELGEILIVFEQKVLLLKSDDGDTMVEYMSTDTILRSYSCADYLYFFLLKNGNYMYLHVNFMEENSGRIVYEDVDAVTLDDIALGEHLGTCQFMVKENSQLCYVWTFQKGLEVETISLPHYAYLTDSTFSADLNTCYLLAADDLIAIDSESGNEIWTRKITSCTTDFDLCKNGKMIENGIGGMYVYDSKTGEQLYHSDYIKYILTVNVETNKVYFYDEISENNENYVKVSSIDLDNYEEEVLYKIDCNKYAFKTRGSTISYDGTYYFILNMTESRYEVYKNGKFLFALPIEPDMVQTAFFIPDSPYVVIQKMENGADIYDCETKELVKNLSVSDFERAEKGNEMTPYLLYTNNTVENTRKTYFLDSDFNIVASIDYHLKPIPGTEYIFTRLGDNCYIMPMYDLDMLLKDAEELME